MTDLKKQTVFDLSAYGILKISGSDAKTFLQGQLTCDMETLAVGAHSLGAHCNPQGRILSLFLIYHAKEVYYLFMIKEMVIPTLHALRKYAVFFNVQMSDESYHYRVLGLLNPSEEHALTELPITCLLLSKKNKQTLCFGKQDDIEMTPQRLLTDAHLCSYSDWHAIHIDAGIPTLYPKTSAELLPHEINLPQLKGVSFTKGCYTGQEIIARMQYKGKLKKRLYRAVITTDLCIEPGMDIYTVSEEGEEVIAGMLIDGCRINHQYSTLILIHLSHEHDKKFLKPLFLKEDKKALFIMREKNDETIKDCSGST